jgi:glycosyltransferase involved in cell wall biosynthesis/peptidoglycan/xylan/chitin deacetylase (PgdA/CDA1 family)
VTPARVLHLIWALDLGGAERQVLEMVRRLDRGRFDPVVGCLVRKGRWGEALEAEGVRVVDFAKKPGLDPTLLARLVRFIRRERPAIVHTHAFTAAAWGRLAAVLAGRPRVVVHEHSAFSLDSALHRTVDRALAPFTDRWVPVSEALAQDLARVLRLPIPRVVTIRNGLPHPAPSPPVDAPALRRELGAERFDPLVGTVGRLERRKGLEVLLQACRDLSEVWPDLGLVLVGEGPEQEILERQARDLGLGDRVVFAGRREDVSRVLSALDVFALPSHTEGLSIALLEAGAAGCPIVATDVGGNPEVIDDRRSGVLVPAGDPRALAEGLAVVLGDRDRARALGEAASRTVRERFSSAGMVQGIEDLYIDLLHPRNGSVRARLKAVPTGARTRGAVRRLVARSVNLVARQPPEPSLRVLTYHRVNDRHPGDRMSVHPLAFRAQMEHIAESGRPVLPLAEAVTRLRGEGAPLPAGAVCLTFDDGYRDNLEFAAPVLERLGLPATVFLVTGRMGAAATIDRYEGCCAYDRALSWPEARELEARGVELGGHGHTHRELATLPAGELREEVSDCCSGFVQSHGKAPRLFCYPRGSENEAVRKAVAEAGFEAAVTVYPGVNLTGTDRLLLRRTEVSGQDDLADFRLKLDGAYDAWHRAWQRFRPRGA